jgi:Tfp pilus assembly protein PilN
MWRADVRSTAFKESERSKRQMSERLGRSTVWAALVAIGLLVLEGILLGGQAWLSAKQARISEQTAPVAKIEEQRSLISKLEQVFQNEVRPIAILEALNTVRPRGIYFTSTTTDIENHITIEGVAQAINELNSYTDTLKKSGRFVLTSDPKSLTRSGKTSFTVTLAYRPDEAPATTQRSK